MAKPPLIATATLPALEMPKESDVFVDEPSRAPILMIASRCAQTIYSQRIHLARVARQRGWQVDFAGQLVEGDYAAMLQLDGFGFHALPVSQQSLNGLALLRLIVAVYALCRKRKPDIFHAFTIKPTIAGLIGAWLARVPVRLATVAGLGHLFISSAPIIRSAGKMLFKFSMRFAHRVYFYNEADREFFVSCGIVDKSKTEIINGSGVDVSSYRVTSAGSGDHFVLLYIGRIISEKGVPELLAAMKLLKTKRSVVLHVVGDVDPSNPSSLDQGAFELELANLGGKWFGHSRNVPQFIATANAVILPSHREGIPLALLEAGASGRPMIATDVPGCKEVVKHGVTGLLIPLGDIEGLATAIDWLADNPAAAEEMGKAAREDMSTRFDTQAVNNALMDQYETFLTRLTARRASFET